MREQILIVIYVMLQTQQKNDLTNTKNASESHRH